MQPVHFRHVHVKNNDLYFGIALVVKRNCFRAVRATMHGVSDTSENLLQDFAKDRFVIHDQQGAFA